MNQWSGTLAPSVLDKASVADPSPARLVRSRLYRACLIAAVALAAAAYVIAAETAPARAALATVDDLTRLIRFMALVKGAMAVGVLWLVYWRLGHPASPRLAGAYILASALMAAGPGLIWQMTHLVAGALLFHAGLALLLLLGWTDRGVAVHGLALAIVRRESR